jgi:PEP-CTERM motif
MKASWILGACLALASHDANAAVLLDQSAAGFVGSFAGGLQISGAGNSFTGGYSEAGQTITTAIAGLLSKIDVNVNGLTPGSTTLRIRKVVGGVVDSNNATALASFAFSAPVWSPSIGFYSTSTIDVSSAGLLFNVGDVFALTFDTAEAKFFGWSDANSYGGGTGFTRGGSSSAWQMSGGDVAFATYVDTNPSSAVPEPATWAMLVVGFGLVGMSIRRRNRRHAFA